MKSYKRKRKIIENQLDSPPKMLNLEKSIRQQGQKESREYSESDLLEMGFPTTIVENKVSPNFFIKPELIQLTNCDKELLVYKLIAIEDLED